MKARIPELLAPAGSLDALLAALAAGADAVYTGLGALNARAAACDLTEADLARACALAHARGARVYVTENVYLREGEAPRALALARAARDAGADALIVADAGLARLLREELPDLELHLSTQAGVMSARAALLAGPAR
ncbi:peptidase U32 family protein, partial [Candidatus Collinsella stercoripullorum]|uniref:peptidase U32 family protein n=1 Tax=Candidatus Collinsella stercoripullorum TaxID=2838522 RepID=UPI0022E09375